MPTLSVIGRDPARGTPVEMTIHGGVIGRVSAEDGPRGAHPREHVRAPDWEEFETFQQAAGGRIRILTLSPEWPGAPAFIRRVAASGVVVAIGHTAASPEMLREAIAAGARLS
jgi:N-acetylglucosamine-6-phosphate deacetylase